MRVLVMAASKHGATSEIAEAIASELAGAEVEPVLVSPDELEEMPHVDAAVIGSAVYAGHWMDTAKRVIERNADALAGMPVWLFSSGPIGDPPKPEEDPVDAARLMELTGAQEHRVFAGRLRRADLGFGEKAIVMALRAPEGDFRDWEAIRAWARDVARSLTKV